MQALLLARTPLARRAFCNSAPPPQPPIKDTPPPPPSSDLPTPPPQPSPSLSLDFSPQEEAEEKQERTGARSSKDSLSSIERKRRNLLRTMFGVLLIGAGVETWYLGRDWDEEELKARKIRIEDVPQDRWGRTLERFKNIFGFFTEPTWPELLPPPLRPPHQKPYTLLVSVDDLLVTSTWDRQHGWRTAKRPGVDYFLAYLSQFYEVVIFTTQYHYTAMPVIDKLDPYQFYITYRLFRDATRSVRGQPVKDLKYLNRDLSKVILLDCHPEHASSQPENAIIVPKWNGDPKDRTLVALIPFLESIAIYKPADVRPILEAYHDKDIPLEYAKKEAEATQKHIEDWQNNRKGLSTGRFTLSGLFGGPTQDNSPVPPTYLEQKRREAQMQYLEEQAYIRANKENFDRLIKEDQEAMAREMQGTFWGAIQTAFTGAPPPKADAPAAAAAPIGGAVQAAAAQGAQEKSS
ncbi:HAD-like protein [Obba rivulosa]|uniref:Mitochondrial import inner membrane translocase subunit TIM50 n=1 Tax=Obba rivulosa TaxID=1052685 RepID=A0A8E2DPS2_9APHY|nr:HAD-like protein [Obba rivulosa]